MYAREWYLRCKECGSYRRGIVDILVPCKKCNKQTEWEKVFWVEHTQGYEYNIRNPKNEKDLDLEGGRQKGKDEFEKVFS